MNFWHTGGVCGDGLYCNTEDLPGLVCSSENVCKIGPGTCLIFVFIYEAERDSDVNL